MKSIKKFTIFAGVNGAGKSTLFSTEAEDNLGIRLNSDEILHSLGLDWADSNAQILAGKQLLRLQKDCLEKGLSFNQETTLSGITILRTISQAKELGYSIHLRYVGVESPEIAKERVICFLYFPRRTDILRRSSIPRLRSFRNSLYR